MGDFRFSIWLKLRVAVHWEISVFLLVDITSGWLLGYFRVSRVDITSGWLLGDFRVSIVWVFLVSIGWYYEWLIIGRFPCLYLAEITSGCPLGYFRVSIGWHYEWLTIGRFPCLNCLSFPCLYWLTLRVVDIGSFPCFNWLSFPSLYWLTLWVVNHWGFPSLYLAEITSGCPLGDFRVSIGWVFRVSIGWHYDWLTIGKFPCLCWLSFPCLYLLSFPCLYWLKLRVVFHWDISVSLLVDITRFTIGRFPCLNCLRFPCLYWMTLRVVDHWKFSMSQLVEFSISLLVDITNGGPLGDFRVSIGWHYEWLPIGRFPCLYWLTLRVVDHWQFSVSQLFEFSMSLLIDNTSGWPLQICRRPKLLFCVSFAWSFLTSWLFHFCVICTRPKSLYS